ESASRGSETAFDAKNVFFAEAVGSFRQEFPTRVSDKSTGQRRWLPEEGRVHGFHGVLAFGQVDDHADLDFAGGNHVDVHPGLGQGVEHSRRYSGVTAHTDANDG